VEAEGEKRNSLEGREEARKTAGGRAGRREEGEEGIA
jgi:hypothetical protein